MTNLQQNNTANKTATSHTTLLIYQQYVHTYMYSYECTYMYVCSQWDFKRERLINVLAPVSWVHDTSKRIQTYSSYSCDLWLLRWQTLEMWWFIMKMHVLVLIKFWHGCALLKTKWQWNCWNYFLGNFLCVNKFFLQIFDYKKTFVFRVMKTV